MPVLGSISNSIAVLAYNHMVYEAQCSLTFGVDRALQSYIYGFSFTQETLMNHQWT